MILELIAEARESGARLRLCCETIELDIRTVQRWLENGPEGGNDKRRGPATSPGNKLSEHERAELIEIATSPEFRDLPPSQIVPQLADIGIYMASESTVYRILHEEKLAKHRGRKASPKRARPAEHTATNPDQVWCWDISYLRAPVRGQFFYLYLFLDVWSRKIVGWRVFDREDNVLAAKAFQEICVEHNVNAEGLVLHSDNGGPMKGATMLATLQELGVMQSFSRPSVSNDNPFIESAFSTVKSRPNYPDKPFEDIEAARLWLTGFVDWYNNEHRHSGISFVTPAQRHAGLDIELLAHRKRVYEAAKSRTPTRWSRSTRRWDRHDTVRLNPKVAAAQAKISKT